MIDLNKRLILIEINQLLTHEQIEQRRLDITYENIKEGKVINHPILVTKVSDNSFMIIDGVHRYYSLRKLGYKKIPCQIVNLNEYELDSWSHLIEKGDWYDTLCEKNVLKIANNTRNNENNAIKLSCGDSLVNRFILVEEKQRLEKLHLMNDFVKSYQDKPFTRVSGKEEAYIKEGYVLISYPKLTLSEIIRYTSKGFLLPTGVTRFLVKGRMLNLNIPLNVLQDTNECEWEKLVRKWEGKLRFYSEPVYLCEA